MSANPAPTTPAPVPEEHVLRVGGGTDCKKLSLAILGVALREKRRPVLEFVGAGACAQAIKAIAIANTTMSRHGQYLTGLPVFVSRAFQDKADATAMQIKLQTHSV